MADEDREPGILELVSTDDLMSELSRRTAAGICAITFTDSGGEKFIGASWGSHFWRSGMADAMSRRFRRNAEALLFSDEDEYEED